MHIDKIGLSCITMYQHVKNIQLPTSYQKY